jgi:hypothetical protein
VLLSMTLAPNVRNVEIEFLELKVSGDDLRRIRRYPKAFGSSVSDGYLQRRLGCLSPGGGLGAWHCTGGTVREHAASATCSRCRTLPQVDFPAASDLTVPPSGSAQLMLCGSNVT